MIDNLDKMSAIEVADEISKLGGSFKGYRSLFVDNGFNGKLISSLSDQSYRECLEDLGITNKLHQRAIIANIKNCGQQLKETASCPSLLDTFICCLSTSLQLCSRNGTYTENSRHSTPVKAAQKDDVISSSINANKVMIFSKTTCPYCSKLKDALTKVKVPFGVMEIDQYSNGPSIQAALLELTGQKTVPNVFIVGKHFGGCDSTLTALKEGKVHTLLGLPNITSRYFYVRLIIMFISFIVVSLLVSLNVRTMVLPDRFYANMSTIFRLYSDISIQTPKKIFEDAKARQSNLSSQGFNFVKELEKRGGYNEESSSSRIDKRRHHAEEANHKTKLNNTDIWNKVISCIRILGSKAAKIAHGIDATANAAKKHVGPFVKAQADRATSTLASHITTFGSGLEGERKGIGYLFAKGLSKLIDLMEENSKKPISFTSTEPLADVFFIGNFANVISNIEDRKNHSSHANKHKKTIKNDQSQLFELTLVAIGLIITMYLLRCSREKDDSGEEFAIHFHFLSTLKPLFTSLPSINLPVLSPPSIDLSLFDGLSKLFVAPEKMIPPSKAPCATNA